MILTAENPIKADEEILISYTEERLETRGLNKNKIFNITKKLMFVILGIVILKIYLRFHT